VPEHIYRAFGGYGDVFSRPLTSTNIPSIAQRNAGLRSRRPNSLDYSSSTCCVERQQMPADAVLWNIGPAPIRWKRRRSRSDHADHRRRRAPEPNMPTPQYGDYQSEIYADGLQGKLPRFPLDYPSLERAAIEVLPSWVYSYVGYGAGDGGTQRANIEAFSRYGIVPRMLVSATERDLSVSLFDMHLPSPLFMPPVGVVGVCAQDMHGDIQAAQASARTGVPMVASTLTQDRMEDVVPHAGDTPNLFQLYTANDRELAASFLRRAEQSGYQAVVITLDTWITGWRPHDLNTANFPQLRGYCLQNYFTDEVFWRGCPNRRRTIPGWRPWSGRRCLAIRCGGTT
jgi:FMN-dependent dehydrogenase